MPGLRRTMIADMGYHFLNPGIQGFDVTRPHILVYERTGRGWQLGALEWVFTEEPATPPLPGATYGSSGAAFNFWHPDLVTLHVWLWHHNPDGRYSGTNPLIKPFNRS